MSHLSRCWQYLACSGWLVLLGSAALAAEPPVQFNRDIRPTFSDTCFHCHGPDKNARKAGLRLDLREAALKPADSGEIPIVPGKPDQSEIIRRLFSKDASERMPPPDAHKTISAKQKAIFRRWVAEGAEYQPHWAYVPLVRPSVPRVKQAAWVANPIDAFVLQQLELQKIKPSAEADRRMLLRRLSLDLIGLPPTPAEVAAFVSDTTPSAYEKQVDRLLASPHYGERMAVSWLDLARFTDTVGFHGDQNQRIFPYRDYVIKAFNTNKQFDQFTIEQLAGDLLPNATPEQRVASGFNRLNMVTREGGAQPKEYLAKYGAERVRTVSTTWLGSTMGCCECHDHKFDPFSARDFYSLQAFFADVKQWGVYADYGYTPNAELKGVNNDYPFYPEIQVDNDFLQSRLAGLKRQAQQIFETATAKLLAEPTQHAALDAWRHEMRAFLQEHADGWLQPQVTAHVLENNKLNNKKQAEVADDGVVRLKFKPAKGDELRLDLSAPRARIAAIRLELVPDGKAKDAIVPALPRQTIRLAASIKPAKGKPRAAGFYFADADFKEPRYSSTIEAIGVTDGWLTSLKHADGKQTSVWLLNPPLQLAEGETLEVIIRGEASPVPVRVSVSPFAMQLPGSAKKAVANTEKTSTPPVDHSPSAVIKADGPPSADEAELFERSTAADAGAFAQYVKLHQAMAECRGGQAYTMVTQAVPPLTVRVLPRGNWQDESGEVVEPAVPHFLPQPKSNGQRLTRLDLAKWICAPENPLTARNAMNRTWKQFFGNGITNVIDDLGAQGEPPSHPELLDWLAVEFRESGWDVKHMIKLMVMSNTYRQSSSLRPELAQLDPNNRLLASQNPRRLEAEFVRDNALSIAGLLNLEIGGPSVKPYQPEGYYANIQFPDRRYVADTDAREYRRGVYMHWQRTFLHPMLANFDAPAREECTANRTVSNTPQQALTLLNDPSFVEASRVFARRLLEAKASDDAARLDLAFELADARAIRPAERQSLLKFLAGQRDYFGKNPAEAEKLLHVGISPEVKTLDAAEWAAWSEVCRVVLNLQETITRY